MRRRCRIPRPKYSLEIPAHKKSATGVASRAYAFFYLKTSYWFAVLPVGLDVVPVGDGESVVEAPVDPVPIFPLVLGAALGSIGLLLVPPIVPAFVSLLCSGEPISASLVLAPPVA